MNRFIVKHEDEAIPVVIDAGSYNCKAGFAGTNIPKIVFRTETNKYKVKKFGLVGRGHREFASSPEDATGCGNGLKTSPIRRGIVIDWDKMEAIWDTIFLKKLKVDPRSHPVLLSESLASPAAHRERTAEAMFESFGVPSLASVVQPQLALYASGRLTGIVQECGSDVCQTMAIYDGRPLPNMARVCEYGGRDLAHLLGRLMVRKSASMSSRSMDIEANFEFLSQVKEAFCYVSMDFERDMSQHPDDLRRTFSLPDGRMITLKEERFKCAESLFTPAFLGLDCEGVHQSIYRTLINCDSIYHRTLYRNVVLSGGASLTGDFAHRMRRELCSLAGANDNVRIVAPPCIAGRRNLESWKRNPSFRKLAVWIGGSLMASSPHFDKITISRAQYGEYGTSAVHRKSHLKVSLQRPQC